MAAGVSTSSTFGGDTLLARLSDTDEEISDTDDSFDYLEAGMASGEFEGVSSDASSISDVTDGSDSEDGSDIMVDPSLPGPSSVADVSDDGTDSDESSNSDSTSDLSSESDGSSGRTAKRAKRSSKRAKTWHNGDSFIPKPFQAFDDSNVGIQAPYKLPVDAKEVEYFKLYFDGELVGDLKAETNRYADQLIATPTARTKSIRDWVMTTTDELYAFFALVILMGVVIKKSMKDYWSKRAVIKTPFFSDVMSRTRFLQILRVLHFVDNSSDRTGTDSDRIWKIRPVYDFLVDKFSSIFVPSRNLCIDESLLLWKGRLFFKQYIPKKRNRFGIKLFVLCDCKTRYILRFFVYTGNETASPSVIKKLGHSGAVVNTLLSPSYLDKGHILFVDNWYSSPILFRYLFKHGTGACGTVRPNRKFMPKFTKKLKRGQTECYKKKMLLALKWRDKRDVGMLTTVHTPAIVDTGKTHHATGEVVRKPECIDSYNKHMGAVDKTDMQISLAECTRKTRKWYKKLFFHLLDLCLYNAFVLYKVNTNNTKMQFVEFRTNVAEQLLASHRPLRVRNPGGRPLSSTPSDTNPLRLVGKCFLFVEDLNKQNISARHFPSLIPETEAQGSNTRRRCYVCMHTQHGRKKRKDTKYMCAECSVPLCVYPCFRNYHTKQQY